MKIIKLGWGLGNQMFQYVFGRYIETATGEKVCFDDSYFFRVGEHNGYRITGNDIESVFNIKLNLLSRYFSSDVWYELVENSKKEGMYRTLRHYYDNPIFVSESWIKGGAQQHDAHEFGYDDGKWILAPTGRFIKNLAFVPGNTYYCGIWPNRMWFYNIKDIITSEFTFRKIDDEKNKEYLYQINNTNSVGFQVRVGIDCCYGFVINAEWYNLAVRYLRERVENPKFFIFSDNPDRCEANLEELGINSNDEAIVIRGNNGVNAYRDMQLLTECKHLIISNGTFGMWSALLNSKKDKIVISPNQHYFI